MTPGKKLMDARASRDVGSGAIVITSPSQQATSLLPLAKAPASALTKDHLLDLPPELRVMIYEYLQEGSKPYSLEFEFASQRAVRWIIYAKCVALALSHPAFYTDLAAEGFLPGRVGIQLFAMARYNNSSWIKQSFPFRAGPWLAKLDIGIKLGPGLNDALRGLAKDIDFGKHVKSLGFYTTLTSAADLHSSQFDKEVIALVEFWGSWKCSRVITFAPSAKVKRQKVIDFRNRVMHAEEIRLEAEA